MPAKATALAAGDRVHVQAEPGRRGEVTEVLAGHGFVVRWDDGHASLWSPSAAGLVREPAPRKRAKRAWAAAAEPREGANT